MYYTSIFFLKNSHPIPANFRETFIETHARQYSHTLNHNDRQRARNSFSVSQSCRRQIILQKFQFAGGVLIVNVPGGCGYTSSCARVDS